MQKPSPKALCEAAGISQSYASMILSDETKHRREPTRALALLMFREFGWRHPVIADLTDEQIAVLQEVETWTPPAEREKAA